MSRFNSARFQKMTIQFLTQIIDTIYLYFFYIFKQMKKRNRKAKSRDLILIINHERKV